MSVVHSITVTPSIKRLEQFSTWSRDVQTVLDYLPRYVAAGRKQRVFALPWEGVPTMLISANLFRKYHEQHCLEPLILPNQWQAYKRFIQQLPVNTQVDAQLKEGSQVYNYEQTISSLYGHGPNISMLLNLPGKGRYFLLAMEQGGTEPIPIRGPDGTGEPIVTKIEVAFNIDIAIYDHGDAFCLRVEDLLQEGYYFWNLVGDPHDIVAKAALIRLVYYFPEIEVSSDSEPGEWWEASLLCQKLFGVADLPPGPWGDIDRPDEDTRKQLISLAKSLPD